METIKVSLNILGQSIKELAASKNEDYSFVSCEVSNRYGKTEIIFNAYINGFELVTSSSASETFQKMKDKLYPSPKVDNIDVEVEIHTDQPELFDALPL